MNFGQSFKLALNSLRTSKMRAFLTMLGIIIGVGAVIVLLSLGNGMTNMMNQQFETLGSNLIQVMVWPRGEGGTRDVDADDLYDLVDQYPQYLTGVSPYVSASAKVRIQYASKYAQSSNYWKNSIGKSRGIRRLDVKGRKQEQEAAFTAWAAKNTLPTEGYSNALNLIRESVEETAPYFASSQYLSEAIGRSVEILAPARLAVSKKGGELTEALKAFYKDYNMPTDRRVAKRMFRIVGENCKELPSVFAEVIGKRFGGDTDAYVDYLYDNSVFADERKALAAAAAGTDVSNDPAVLLNKSYTAKMRELAAAQLAGKRKFADGQRLYIAGLMRMQPNKAWASDANFTLRLTYGRVLPYDPADGIHYNYYTTLKGVMEKENPQNPTEFTVPARLKELYAAKDFGRYANERGELPVAFLADCDITGGNSGSPVLNAKGTLLGLAFDGNWEAMSGDVAFEPELQRTIAVDVRYVLFVIDKFAGAGWLLDELQFE